MDLKGKCTRPGGHVTQAAFAAHHEDLPVNDLAEHAISLGEQKENVPVNFFYFPEDSLRTGSAPERQCAQVTHVRYMQSLE